MSLGRQVAASNRDKAASKIASLKDCIVAEIRKSGCDSPLSNHTLYARINLGLDRGNPEHRLKITPVADISSATSALKRSGVLVEVGTGINEKGNEEVLMTLGEWASVPPDRAALAEAGKLRSKISRELAKLAPEVQIAIATHCLRYIARKTKS